MDAPLAAEAISKITTFFNGSEEFGQVAELISKSPKIVLDTEVAQSIGRAMFANPASIERNLDLVALPEGLDSLWIELECDDIGTYYMNEIPGKEMPRISKVGFCVAKTSERDDDLVAMVVRKAETGEVTLSMSLQYLSIPHLHNHAILARGGMSSDPVESRTRMMMQLTTVMPPAFRDYTTITADIHPDRTLAQHMEAARRSSTEHGLLLKACLIAMHCENVAASIQHTDRTIGAGLCSFLADVAPRRSLIERASSWLSRRDAGIMKKAQNIGFLRRGDASPQVALMRSYQGLPI